MGSWIHGRDMHWGVISSPIHSGNTMVWLHILRLISMVAALLCARACTDLWFILKISAKRSSKPLLAAPTEATPRTNAPCLHDSYS